jgi:hypothetical protein
MVGHIGRVERAAEGSSYGFVVYDEIAKPCVYIGFPTWHQAGQAAREMAGLMVTAVACVKR